MIKITSKITAKGQITIPAQVRRHLGIGTNDRVVFVLEQDGMVRLEKPRYPTIGSLAGAAGSLDRSMSWHEMREIARDEHIRARYESEQ